MKTIYKSLLALSVGSLMTVGAQAATYNNANTAYNNNGYANNGSYFSMPYIGLKAGQVSIDDDGLNDVDDPTTYGVYGGFSFDPNFGVELEYMGSDDSDFTKTINGIDYDGEFDVKQYGIYGTYRYYFPNTSGLYGKAKLGVAKSEAEFDYDSNIRSDFDRDDTSIAGGLGLGFSASPNFAIEAEYAAAGGDVEPNTITLGAHVKF